eukprot:6078426-Ditylum_brightwellii.AAC.1
MLIHCQFIHSESRQEQCIKDLFQDQVTQIQEINGEDAITRSNQVTLQLNSKPVSVYRQINKATINAMCKTNNYDELKDIMK